MSLLKIDFKMLEMSISSVLPVMDLDLYYLGNIKQFHSSLFTKENAFEDILNETIGNILCTVVMPFSNRNSFQSKLVLLSNYCNNNFYNTLDFVIESILVSLLENKAHFKSYDKLKMLSKKVQLKESYYSKAQHDEANETLTKLIEIFSDRPKVIALIEEKNPSILANNFAKDNFVKVSVSPIEKEQSLFIVNLTNDSEKSFTCEEFKIENSNHYQREQTDGEYNESFVVASQTTEGKRLVIELKEDDGVKGFYLKDCRRNPEYTNENTKMFLDSKEALLYLENINQNNINETEKLLG